MGLVITGSIALFFAVLLFSPVCLRFAYRGGKINASVHYVFFKISLLREKTEADRKKEAKRRKRQEARISKKAAKKKDEDETKQKKISGNLGSVKNIWEIVKACKKVDALRRRLIFYKIDVAIAVGGDDAMKTATSYGMVCALSANIISLLSALFTVKKPNVRIRPDFMLDKTAADISFRMRITPFYVFAAGFRVIYEIVKIILKNKNKRKKGGKQNEPTTASGQ
ncbi:MAG: DUF2953 domain-containing protein [Oscillospiraceae bacterium]|nr:DUF2953 domain-containing protein [Oscillospiraceae bacterium]